MTGQYAYTPYIWPMLASPAILLLFVREAWRHRRAPISRPFVALVACLLAWASATAALWLSLGCANLGRWLSPADMVKGRPGR